MTAEDQNSLLEVEFKVQAKGTMKNDRSFDFHKRRHAETRTEEVKQDNVEAAVSTDTQQEESKENARE